MKKSLMLVIIQLVVVGVVLALTVVSFAWFTSNTHVYTSNVTVLSETSSDVSVVLEPDEYTPYKGETGQGYNDPSHPDLVLDIPYTAIKRFTMTCTPVEKSTVYGFCAYYTQISITKTDDQVVDINSDNQILDSFTFRFYIYDENDIVIATYTPEEGTNFIVKVSEDETNGSYLIIDEPMVFKCGFEVIFLDEDSYKNWLDEKYLDVNAFKYSDYDFMRAMFNITFKVGMNTLN
ncbi:MAG TPA: hypothetical protein VJ903_02455 [Clostridia bacterium]|nr:hypothetical protein [Clostridia bacterium]